MLHTLLQIIPSVPYPAPYVGGYGGGFGSYGGYVGNGLSALAGALVPVIIVFLNGRIERSKTVAKVTADSTSNTEQWIRERFMQLVDVRMKEKDEQIATLKVQVDRNEVRIDELETAVEECKRERDELKLKLGMPR